MLDAMTAPNPLSEAGWVLVESAVLRIVASFRQDSDYKLEAGGILLGFRRGPHLHVVEATTPTDRDRRWRTGFERSAERHQCAASLRWRDTGGTMDYLGEWHTHPEADPSPSGVDLAAWKAIYATRMNRPFIFIIAGRGDRCWIGVAQASTLKRLSLSHDVLRDAE